MIMNTGLLYSKVSFMMLISAYHLRTDIYLLIPIETLSNDTYAEAILLIVQTESIARNIITPDKEVRLLTEKYFPLEKEIFSTGQRGTFTN